MYAFGTRRIVLAYLYEKVALTVEGKMSDSLLKEYLKKWKKVTPCDKLEFAQKVMDSPTYKKWLKRTEEIRDYLSKEKQAEKDKKKSKSYSGA